MHLAVYKNLKSRSNLSNGNSNRPPANYRENAKDSGGKKCKTPSQTDPFTE